MISTCYTRRPRPISCGGPRTFSHVVPTPVRAYRKPLVSSSMFQFFLWALPLLLSPPGTREMTDRMVPDGFVGNYWGPSATKARHEGRMPQFEITPHMARWDNWGRQVLRDGDIVFRLGDARVLRGM